MYTAATAPLGKGSACPGGASYEVLPTFQVAVAGTPIAYDTPAHIARVQKVWTNYGSAIQQAAARYQVPVTWIVGILASESGGNPNACSPCEPVHCPGVYKTGACATERCCAYGLMQHTGATARSYGASGLQLLGNAALSIDLGAAVMSDLIYGNRHIKKPVGLDLVRVAAAYNAGPGWRCGGSGIFRNKENPNYAEHVVRYANTAYQMGIRPGMGSTVAATSLVAAVLIGAAVALGVRTYL